MIARPTKVYDFTAHARRQPTAPPPGDRLDAQLQNHADAITAVQMAVEQLTQTAPAIDVPALAAEIKAYALAELNDLRQQVHNASVLVEHAHLETARAKADAERAREVADRAEARLAAAVEKAAVALAPQPQAGLPSNTLPTPTLYVNAGGPYAGDDAGATATSADYAQVSIEWAEHMPDTIPPNILAINAISGQHWSSRWWASRAAGAFGMLAWWYMGAFYDPGPPTTPYTPTGDPIPVGAMYFNLTHNVLMVWNGSAWVSTLPGSSKTVTMSLYYHSVAGQTVFPLTTNDLYGHNFTYNETITEGTQVIVAGDRVEPSTFSINTSTSVVTFHAPVNPAGTLVVFDILTPPSEFSAGICLVNPIPVDGTTTTFGSLTIVAGGTPVNATRSEDLFVSVDGVIQEPVVMYSAFGDSITFVTPPGADSEVFMVWFGPVAGGGTGGGGGGGGGGTPSNLLPLMDDDPALVGTSLSFARGDHRHPTDSTLLPLAGGTMLGDLFLNHDPTAGLQAATKAYVDAVGSVGGRGGAIISPIPPTSVVAGQLWFDDVGGQLYVYYDDGTSSQWVIVTNEPGPPGPTGPTGLTGAPGAPGATGPTGAGIIPAPVAPPLAATWTQRNFNPGVTTLTDVANGVALYDASTQGGTNILRSASQAAPTAPYSIDMNFCANLLVPASAYCKVGVGWTDGTKAQVVFLMLVAASNVLSNNLSGETYSNFSTFNAAFGGAANPSLTPGNFWFRLRDDGTNVYWYSSNDGVSWTLFYSTTKSAGYLGASGYTNPCFILDSIMGATGLGTLTLKSWWVH